MPEQSTIYHAHNKVGKKDTAEAITRQCGKCYSLASSSPPLAVCTSYRVSAHWRFSSRLHAPSWLLFQSYCFGTWTPSVLHKHGNHLRFVKNILHVLIYALEMMGWAFIHTWKEVLFLVPKAVLGESVPLLVASGVPPMEYRFGVLAGDSGVSGALVLGLLDDRNLALADSVAAM